MTDLLEVIDRLVVELQDVAGAETERDREDGAGLMCDDDEAIDIEDRAVHTEDGSIHVHNEDGVGHAAIFSAAGLVCFANIHGPAVVEGKNQNEAEGVAFAAVVDSDLANSGTGNQRTAPWTLCSVQIFHLLLLLLLLILGRPP